MARTPLEYSITVREVSQPTCATDIIIIIIIMQNTPVQAQNIKVKYITTLISTNSINHINHREHCIQFGYKLVCSRPETPCEQSKRDRRGQMTKEPTNEK